MRPATAPLPAGIALARSLALGVLAASGALLAFGRDAGALVSTHRLLAESLLALCIADVAVAFAISVYVERPAAWLARVCLLLLTAGAYLAGFASGAGEAGEEGRAHAARALAFPFPPLVALAAHAGFALAALALSFAPRAQQGGPRATRRVVATWGVGVLALALAASAPAALWAAQMPAVAGAEVVHAPWVARPLSPLEASHPGVAVALAIAIVSALALMPLAARDSRAWRRVCAATYCLAAVAFGFLTIAVSLSPSGH